MKKKKIFLALIASSFIATAFSSCGNSNPTANNTGSQIASTNNTTNDNTGSQIVPTNSIDIENTISSNTDDIINQEDTKEVVINENDGYKYKIVSKKIDDTWVDIYKYRYINDEFKIIFDIKLDSKNSLKSKNDYTYDDNGNILTKTRSTYANGNWIAIDFYEYINNEAKEVCAITLDSNSMYLNKVEYKYDDRAKLIEEINSEYIDNSWVTINRYKLINNSMTKVYALYKNTNNVYGYEEELILDDNDNKSVLLFKELVNGEWIKTSEYRYYNNKQCIIYELSLDSNKNYKSLKTYTYSNDGNMLTKTESKYINNEWIKVKESKYFYNAESNSEYNIYYLKFKFDDEYDTLSESEIDDNGNILSEKYSKYLNGKWVTLSEYKNINNDLKLIYEISLNLDNTFNYKKEYTYSDDGNKLKELEYKYINDEWIKTKESKNINGELKIIYELVINTNTNAYFSKTESEYDLNGNILSQVESRYLNGEWVKIKESKNINGKFIRVYIASIFDDVLAYQATYTYDNDGNYLNKLELEYVNNEWIKIGEYVYIDGKEYCIYSLSLDYTSKYEYTYDSYGNTLTKVTSKFINNEWVKILEQNNINNNLETVYEILFNTDGTFNLKKENIFDNDGNKLSKIDSKYLNGKWEKLTEYKYFNDAEKIIYRLVLNPDNTYGYKVEKTYSNDGELTNEKFFDYINNTWIKTLENILIDGKSCTIFELFLDDDVFSYKNEYTYDSNGNNLSKIRSNYKDGSWVYSIKNEYVFENNKCKNLMLYKYINNKWVKLEESIRINGGTYSVYEATLNTDDSIKRIEEYAYDSNGNLLKKLRYDYENNILVYELKYEYTYDLAGNRITFLDTQYDHKNSIEYKSKYEFTYDNMGNKLTEVYSEFENSSWVYKTKYVFAYDSSGNKISETKYVYKDGSWVKS